MKSWRRSNNVDLDARRDEVEMMKVLFKISSGGEIITANELCF